MKRSGGRLPKLVYKGSDDGEGENSYINAIVDQISLLRESYEPPPVWGTNGHLQTTMFSLKESRPGLDLSGLESKRCYVMLVDGTRVSYDIFPASKDTFEEGNDITLMVCPGLANSSNSMYIRAFTLQATQNGYRTIVLNHLGVLDEQLTTARIFNLGSTEEYGAMVRSVRESLPNTSMIAVGFSLGANIVCKYLGEDSKNQKGFICAISLCQGYDFHRMKTTMNTWSKLKKLYAKQLSKKVQKTVLNNWHHLAETLCTKHQSSDSEESQKSTNELHRKVKKSKLMPKLDELVTIRLSGHDSVDSYYNWASSRHYLDRISVPILFVNAKDDPLFDAESLQHPIEKAKSHKQVLMVLTKHGGHLGFFTKTGKSTIDSTTWLERMLLQYIQAAVNVDKRCGSVPPSMTPHLPQDQVACTQLTTSNQHDMNSNYRMEHEQLDYSPDPTNKVQTKRRCRKQETTV